MQKKKLYLVIYLQLEAYVDVDEKFTDFVLFLFVCLFFRDYRVHKAQDSLINPSESLDRFRGLVNLALVFLVSENCITSCVERKQNSGNK